MAAKYRQVADDLMLRIRRGEIENGDKLPGEVDLAETYDVSRTTIRQALATLQQVGLIETWTGSGSYVRYDGAILDDTSGWTKALAGLGVETEARVLRLDRILDAALAKELGLTSPTFLAVDRVRSIVGGEAISIERSRLPWRKTFATIARDGLIDGSLQRTIESFAIRPRGGWETVGLAHLSAADAELLARAEGDAFLATRRIVHDTSGDLIECVDSLLHPGHFKLQFKFGEGAK